jgi:murein DD-endopeptidase MepM/ murein hydrolase activator NlpD
MLALFLLLAGGFALLLGGGGAPVEQAMREPAPQAFAARAPANPAAPLPGGRLLVPVAGVERSALTDSWGDPRGGGTRAHQAIDIMAPRGTPVIAAAAGRIEKLFDSQDGGLTVYIRSPDGGTVHYYSHLDGYRAGLAEGQQVRAGDVLGTVGSTGNAGPDAPHLHFEVKRMAPGEAWHQGTPVNPFPLLAAD